MLSKQLGSDLTLYQYDAENRLQQVVKNDTVIADYVYDGDGGRTQKITADGTVHFVGGLFETQGSQATSHMYLGDTRVASVSDGALMIYHHDHLGGTNVISDEQGAKLELIEYQPFGQKSRHDKYGQGPTVAHHYFTSQYQDIETGLYYYGARYYDPSLGRFITPDTIVQNPEGNPQTFNRYSYTGNNPLNYTDPTGHFFGFIVAAIVKAVVAAATYVAANAAAIATGALVGGVVGGTASVAMGGNFWQGAAIGAIGGGVFAGLAQGLSILGDNVARGLTLGGAAGPLTPGVAAISNFTAGFLGGAASGAAVAGYAGADVGKGALIGGAFAGGFSLARDFASYTRRKMIAQSKLNLKNASGKSAGFKGDGFKLGGGRENPNNPGGGPSPLGGHQGGPGEIFGRPYAPGSFGDGLVEAFAGPHDFLNSWAYDPLSGNIAQLNPVQQFVTNFSNPGNVLLASPIVAASVAPQATAAAGGIIYGQSQGNISRRVSDEGGSMGSLVVSH